MDINNNLLEFKKELEKYNTTKDPESLYKINKLINENSAISDYISVNTSDDYKFLRICTIFSQFLF